jgi:hypothetical protein
MYRNSYNKVGIRQQLPAMLAFLNTMPPRPDLPVL